MIKHYCDICGKEVNDTNSIRLYTWVNKGYDDIERRWFDVCSDCKALLELYRQKFEADFIEQNSSNKSIK